MNAAASPVLALKFQTWRSRLLLIALLAWFVALVVRAFYLQGLHNDFLQAKGESRYSRVISLSATRGMIVDRHNEPLAISTPVESVAASPADIEISAEESGRLARLLDMNVAELKRKLADTKREFVYLKRQLPPEHAAKIVELNIPGVFLQREYRRYYPAGEVTAHLIGFTDVDDKGQEALELAFEETLTGRPGSRRVIKDRRGHIVEDIESIRHPQHGAKLVLSIDARIQYLAFRELKKAVIAHRAKAGGIVVLDPRTGEVLAMANLPSYNPNNRGKLDPRRTRNRAVTDLFEPGSTLKPFTAAVALEAGTFTPETIIQTAPGSFTIGKRTIHDAHPHGALTVSQVVQKSSNIGMAKMALSLPPEAMWTLFKQVGFGAQPHSGFPGEVAGVLRGYATWKPIEQATMSYGHGISLPYDTLKDLTPVSLLGRQPNMVVVHPGVPAKSMRELLELAKKPGQVNYGSGGVGTASHLATEMLKLMTKTDMVHVPYKGLGPALTDLMGGRLHVIISTMASALPHMKTGKLRPLAVTTASRSSFFPEVPTMDEAGVKGYEFSTWYGLLVPAGTPRAVVDRLNAETRKALASAAVKEQFAAQGLETAPSTPQEFTAYLRSEVAKWGKVIKASGATTE